MYHDFQPADLIGLSTNEKHYIHTMTKHVLQWQFSGLCGLWRDHLRVLQRMLRLKNGRFCSDFERRVKKKKKSALIYVLLKKQQQQQQLLINQTMNTKYVNVKHVRLWYGNPTLGGAHGPSGLDWRAFVIHKDKQGCF